MEKIIGQDGGKYLILVEENPDPLKQKARILDTVQMIYYKRWFLERIYKFMPYWQDFKGEQEELKELKKKVLQNEEK